MLPIIQQIVNEYKTNLKQLYGSELAELILFGSYARDDFGEESDVDFAVVLRDPNTRIAAEIANTSVIGSRLSFKIWSHAFHPTYYTPKKKQTLMQGVYQAIRSEGIVI